jgi:phage terminase Nu1 subunit (DNA packaging protein)
LLIDLNKVANQKEFSKIIGVSEAAVSNMKTAGVITKGQTMGEWILAYSSHLREQAAGRATKGDLDLATERAGLARAQRERIEMQNAVTRGELAPTIMMEQVLAKVASKIVGPLDAIWPNLRRRVPTLSAKEGEIITGVIAEARNVIGSMSLDILNEEDESTSANAADDAAVAESIG